MERKREGGAACEVGFGANIGATFTCAHRVRAIAFGGHTTARALDTAWRCFEAAARPVEPRDVLKPPRGFRWASLAMECADTNKSVGSKGPDCKRPIMRRVEGEGVLRAPRGVCLLRCIRQAGARFWHVCSRCRVGRMTAVQMAQAMGVAVWWHAVVLAQEDIAMMVPPAAAKAMVIMMRQLVFGGEA